MNVYIPVGGIITFAFWYLLIGMILVIPLVAWQNRFISGNREWHEGVRFWRALFIGSVFWPVMLFFTIKTEIEYRRKGYL